MPSATKEIALPFVGFYESVLDDTLQQAQELELESATEANETIAAPDWAMIYLKVAQIYVRTYNEEFFNNTGINLQLAFSRLTSPSEYNFETDRVFATADSHALAQVISKIGLNKVRASLREHYKPSSGWSPFASTLKSIEGVYTNFPHLFYSDVILELLFKSEIIYNCDYFLTNVRESYSN